MGNMNGPKVDVEQLMQRIRAEVERRRSGQSARLEPAVLPSESILTKETDSPISTPPIQPIQDLPVPRPVQLNLAELDEVATQPAFQPTADGQYHLDELLDYHDRDFINAAYWAVLRRAPDEGGLDRYLGLLRRGTPKVEVLALLRASPEGRAAAVPVAGLSLQASIPKLSRWPVVGPLIRLVTALLSLPEKQRAQHAFEGRIIALMEQTQARSRDSLLVVNRALRDLENGYRQLTVYAASKPGRDALNQVEASIETARDAVNAVRALVDKKADGDDTQRSLDEVRRSLQLLHAAKAEVSDVDRIDLHFRDTAIALKILQSSKADQSLVEETRHVFTHALDTKADRTALGAANYELKASLEAMRTEARTSLEAALHGINQALESLAHSKVDFGVLVTKQAEVEAALETAINAVNQSVTELSQSKADRTALEAADGELKASLEAVRSDARTALEAALHGVNQSLEVTLNAITQTVGELSQTKANRTELAEQIATTHGETIQAIQKIQESKADRASLDEARHLLIRSLETKAERHEITALTNHFVSMVQTRLTKEDIAPIEQSHDALVRRMNSDQVAAEAANGRLRASVEAARTDAKASLEQALYDINQVLELFAQSKVDSSVLETAQAEARVAQEAALKQVQEALRNALIPIDARAHDLRRNVLDQERRLGLLLEEARKRLPAPLSTEQLKTMLVEEDHRLDAMYASFEDRFRGTNEEIKRRQRIYLPYIREANAGAIDAHVVDLGCGRGEWLELLRDEGLIARGVDVNRIFLARCREVNLDVIEQDAVDFLRQLKPASVGAVTSYHLIEHLPLTVLVALFDETIRVLKPGGVAIFETPNPGNLLVGSCNFYFDPTHRNPLPARTTQALLEIRGFSKIEIIYLHPYVSEDRLVEGAEQVQRVLNQYLFGPQDYAVIAKKV